MMGKLMEMLMGQKEARRAVVETARNMIAEMRMALGAMDMDIVDEMSKLCDRMESREADTIEMIGDLTNLMKEEN